MKRKWFAYLGVAFLAAGVVLHANLGMNAKSEIDLALRNAEVLAAGEGGNTHSLKCQGTVGWCTGKCNIHQVEMGKTGKDDTAEFTCSG